MSAKRRETMHVMRLQCHSTASSETTSAESTSARTSPVSSASTGDVADPGDLPISMVAMHPDAQDWYGGIGDSNDIASDGRPVCGTGQALDVHRIDSLSLLSRRSRTQSLPTINERSEACLACQDMGRSRTQSLPTISDSSGTCSACQDMGRYADRVSASNVCHEVGLCQERSVNRQMSAKRRETMHVKRVQVLAAVRSLYADKLKPHGRMILRRVREHAAEAEATLHAAGRHADEAGIEDAPRVDPRALQRICRSCTELRVIQEGDTLYSAYLVDQPRALFVDIDSPEDPYSANLWSSLTSYFETLQDSDLVLGGRYMFASALMKRRLPCLLMRSLGELCHIVGLAICQKRLLGYLEGNVVPFARSEACTKKWCALNEISMSKNGLLAATMEEVREGVELLLRQSAGVGLVFASLKRRFRECFAKEFSETALGYVRIHDVFNDPRLQEVCSVQGDRILPLSAKGSAPPPLSGRLRASTSEASPAFAGGDGGELTSHVRCLHRHGPTMDSDVVAGCETFASGQGLVHVRRISSHASLSDASGGPCHDAHSTHSPTAPTGPTTSRVTHSQVLTAIRTLYADELKPLGHMVLRRVREHMIAAAARAAGRRADFEHGPRVDAGRLRKLCMSCSELRVVHEGTREYAAYLADQPNALFVDVESAEDPYPSELWAALAAHFETLRDVRLAAGRYAYAKALMQYQFPCLAHRSLGQVCHIVALAIAQKRLLGYSKGQVVLFSRSEACAKKWRALHELPMLPNGLPAATVEEARKGLSTLLCRRDASIHVSAVKQAFRIHLQKDLSETALGHVRLRDLLVDPRFRDVCTVSGDFVLPGPGRFAAPHGPLQARSTRQPAHAPMPFRPPPGL